MKYNNIKWLFKFKFFLIIILFNFSCKSKAVNSFELRNLEALFQNNKIKCISILDRNSITRYALGDHEINEKFVTKQYYNALIIKVEKISFANGFISMKSNSRALDVDFFIYNIKHMIYWQFFEDDGDLFLVKTSAYRKPHEYIFPSEKKNFYR